MNRVELSAIVSELAWTNGRSRRARATRKRKTRMMPSTVKASTGIRSSQRSRCSATDGASSTGSAGESVADSLAVREAEGGADLQAEPGEDDFGFQKVPLDVCRRMPPDVVFSHGITDDPDRNRSTDRVASPALDQCAPVDIRQRQVDQDQRRDPASGEDVGVPAGAHMFDRHPVTPKLQEIQIGEGRIVLDQ